jgi:hypothetical protein
VLEAGQGLHVQVGDVVARGGPQLRLVQVTQVVGLVGRAADDLEGAVALEDVLQRL